MKFSNWDSYTSTIGTHAGQRLVSEPVFWLLTTALLLPSRHALHIVEDAAFLGSREMWPGHVSRWESIGCWNECDGNERDP
jgi:hypothetical protein